MIDPKELKLGNYIYASGLYENRLVKVEQIGSKGTLSEDKRVIMFEGLNVGEFSCDCNPIPLTPEWLQKFQFIDPAKNGMAYRINISSVDELCWYVQDGFLRYQTQLNGFTRQLPHINSVHLLQNYFYFLTGRELEPVTTNN